MTSIANDPNAYPIRGINPWNMPKKRGIRSARFLLRCGLAKQLQTVTLIASADRARPNSMIAVIEMAKSFDMLRYVVLG